MAKVAAFPAPSFKPEPAFVPLRIPGLKSLLRNGLSRGIVAEVNGRRSCGRTAVCLHFLAQATQQGEICALVDMYDRFHPASAAAAGVALDRLVWVRCRGNAENALRTTDLFVHAGGFGIVLLDISDASPRMLKQIPLSYWYRFRRAIENTPTILLLSADTKQARSSSLTIELERRRYRWSGNLPLRILEAVEGAAISKTAAIPPEPLVICPVA